MLFNSFRFIFAFAPVFLLGWFALRRQRGRVIWLAVLSYAFYAFAGHLFPLLLVVATLWSWGGGIAIESAPPERRKATLWLSIVGPLAVLVVFKYTGFFVDNSASVVSALTGHGLPSWHAFAHGIVLPVGISFYTFEAISYVIDVHRGRIPAERDLVRYATFMAYFPHLIAGPIVRYERLGPQLRRFWRFDAGSFYSGIVLFSIGLVKKVLIADTLATYSDPRFSAPTHLHQAETWLALLCFYGQIYFDFSGYTDMALGLSRMIGIDLPWNFDRPWRSSSPTDFWNRWNVTLSRWLRDYLYVPLNQRRPDGTRSSGRRRDLTLLLTMGIAGLWHGASLNFLLWGLYMGGLAVASRRLGRSTGIELPRPVAIAITFVLVVIGGVFFRVHDLHSVPHVYAAMLGLHGFGGGFSVAFAAFMALLLVYTFTVPEEWRWQPERWVGARLVAGTALAGALVGIAFLWMVAPPQPFVYFQF
jgi:alginate O-acetyltransferase complex protein AlgI